MRKNKFSIYLRKEYTVIKSIFILIFAIFLSSCHKNENSRNLDVTINQMLDMKPINITKKCENIDATVNIIFTGVEIMNSDFQIDSFKKITSYIDFNESGISMELNIRIINPELLLQLNELIDPIIYLEINDKKYLSKSFKIKDYSGPIKDEFIFIIDDNGKILFFNNIISFIKYNE
jgi:hypothetical protein